MGEEPQEAQAVPVPVIMLNHAVDGVGLVLEAHGFNLPQPLVFQAQRYRITVEERAASSIVLPSGPLPFRRNGA